MRFWAYFEQEQNFAEHQKMYLSEIMRQPWPAQFKNGFWDLFARGKSPKVSVLEAESSPRRHDSKNFAEKVIFPRILDILVHRWPTSCVISNL